MHRQFPAKKFAEDLPKLWQYLITVYGALTLIQHEIQGVVGDLLQFAVGQNIGSYAIDGDRGLAPQPLFVIHGQAITDIWAATIRN